MEQFPYWHSKGIEDMGSKPVSPQFYEPIVRETIDKLLGPRINITDRQKKDKDL